MDLNKKDLLFGGGIVVVLGLLTVFMRGKNPSASDGNTADMVGGFKTAETVYVPTTSYDLHYDTNNGTIIHNGSATTYVPPAAGGTVSTPTQDAPPPQTSTTSGSSTVPTTAPTTAPIHESHPSPPPQGTNTAPIFTAPSQSNALAQLYALQQTIDRESSQLGAQNFYQSNDRDILHSQKIELAREAGLSVDANGYVYDANGSRIDLKGTH